MFCIESFKKLITSSGVVVIASLLSGCITQAVTAPVQVASQGAQTTGQTAGQAAQVVALNDSDSSSNTTIYQASASSNETSDVKKALRNNP